MIPGPKLDFKSDIRVSYLMILHQKMLFVRSLCQSEAPFDDRIHEIRKTVKKMRAIIRLLRNKYEDESRQWDERLQNINLSLSRVRDAAVFNYTYQKYFKNTVGHNDNYWEQILTSFYETEQIRVSDKHPFENIAHEMMLMVESITFDTLKKITMDDLILGTILTYKKAKNRFWKLLHETKNEMVHPFRKSMKRLEYQVDIFPVTEDSSLFKWLTVVDKLTDLLGSYNDLDAFCSWIKENELVGENRICELAGKQKRDINRNIIELGSNATGWKTKNFERMLREESEAVLD